MQIPGHFSRRCFLVQVAVTIAIPSLTGCGNTSSGSQTFRIGSVEAAPSSTTTSPTDTKPKETMDIDNKAPTKTLVIYFSHSGNTRVIANFVHEFAGGDFLELKTVDAYPQNYDQCVEQARKELDANFRPKLQTRFENLDDYSTIYLGYPNWWGTTPMAVATMLENYDFSGKTIIPFCTHEGSALGQSTKDIAKWSPKSSLENGLAIRGRSVKNAKPDVEKWLRQLGKIK